MLCASLQQSYSSSEIQSKLSHTGSITENRNVAWSAVTTFQMLPARCSRSTPGTASKGYQKGTFQEFYKKRDGHPRMGLKLEPPNISLLFSSHPSPCKGRQVQDPESSSKFLVQNGRSTISLLLWGKLFRRN